MRGSCVLFALTVALLAAAHVDAQDEPPRIGPFVVDAHGTVPLFKTDAGIAASRGLSASELPGAGLGVNVAIHVYPLKWKAVTFGLGGELTLARAHQSPADPQAFSAVTETYKTVNAQLSLNFGTGNGWSYLSGGIGPAWWKIVPDGQPEGPADQDRLREVNYGGGARWFAKPHLAFSVDARWHQVDPGFAHGIFPASPRTTFLIVGAGVSIK